MSSKFVLCLIALTASASAHAAWPILGRSPADDNNIRIDTPAKPAAPNVSCEIMYRETNESGATVDFARGESVTVTTKGAITTNHGFKLIAMLGRLCAADSGPCANRYVLRAQISEDKVSSTMNINLSEGPNGWSRYSFELTDGNRRGSVNCDYDTRK